MAARANLKPIVHTCIVCGVKFESAARNAKYCDNCRIRPLGRNKVKPTPRAAEKSIRQITRELEEYNRKNKTLLTYGQYVAMTDDDK